MSLASGLFVGFLCLVCLVAYLVPARFRYIWLLLCSYFFYLYDPGSFTRYLPALGMMLVCTFASYFCAIGVEKAQKMYAKRIFLGLGIGVGLAMLLVCKYTNFFLESLGQASKLVGQGFLFEPVNLILPLGISYYTLQTISYCLDVYKGKLAAEKNPLRYALYVSFFPGVVTGPINRATALLPQYKNPAPFSYDRVAGGFFRVLWGLCKKLIIADRLGLYTAAVFHSPGEYSGPQLIFGILAFSYQLYMDFSGSIDVAMGASRMLGFDFCENFNRPFAAKNFQDVWRRWHISLTSFFRDYVYFPLGGSRVSTPRWMLNTMVIFLVSAFWHGDGVGYLIWGFLNGVVLICCKMFDEKKERLVSAVPLYRIPAVRGFFQRIFVYLLFAGCFAFFAFSLYNTSVVDFMAPLGTGWAELFGPGLLRALNGTPWGLGTVLIVVLGAVFVELVEMWAVHPGESSVASWIRARGWYLRWPLYYLVLCALMLLGMFGQSTFIYQQY